MYKASSEIADYSLEIHLKYHVPTLMSFYYSPETE